MIDLQPSQYPLLSGIESPRDLRKLSVTQLPDLCAEIRRFLIEQLADNPGHFASSMGAVDLTVALHYVFDTPYDRIVWDVGHQAYGHKLLTGRARLFDGNRRMGGLSGFPNPDESEYDTFSAGHASNSISAALGMSVASALKGENPRRKAVAVIGDASISGGLAFEGLNNASNSDSNLLIVLNDNDMSIDRNVGSLNSYLTHLNTNRTYNNLRFKLYSVLRRYNVLNEKSRRSILRFNNSLKALLAREQNIFEGLNIRYFGPFDGHDVVKLVRVMTDIRDMGGPKILHLRTVKGKGYAPAEGNPADWHAPGRFNPATGIRLAEMHTDSPKPLKYQEVAGGTLVKLADANPRIVAITAAMPSGTSLNLMQEAHPGRTFDVGISEGHAVTFAGGLAREGLLPFVAIYSSFLQRGYDQIINDVALQNLPVTFCIDRAGLVGEDGATHHGLFDVAYMCSVPHMTVAAPRNARWLADLMHTAQANPAGPFAIRYPRGATDVTSLPLPLREVPIGRGERLTEGRDLTVVALGPLAERARAIAEELRSEGGPEVCVIDPIFVKPLDEELICDALANGAPVITVEDGTLRGGLGCAVAAMMSAKGLTNPLKMLGVDDAFVTQGTPAELHRLCGIDAESLRRQMTDFARRSPGSNKD